MWIADAAGLEGDEGTSEVTFLLSLSRPSDVSVTVDLNTTDDTAAVADGDYEPVAGVVITFAPGVTTKTVSVTINGDTQVETDETFFAQLTDAVGATIARGQATGTIENDDGQFDLSLALVPTPTDPDGQVAEVPQSEPWIDVWTSFWAEIWVRVSELDASGVQGASVTVGYDASYFTATIVEAGSAFAEGFTTETDPDVGRVHLAGQSTTVVGAGAHVLLARVLFEPTGSDLGGPVEDPTTPIAPVGKVWLGIVDPAIAGGDAAGATISPLHAPPSTELWPVLYDLDRDGRVGFGDLARFAAGFLKNTTDSPEVVRSDFNMDGRVNFGDFALFAANFLNRAGSDTPLVYPANFPEDWSPSKLLFTAIFPAIVPEDAKDDPEVVPIVQLVVDMITEAGVPDDFDPLDLPVRIVYAPNESLNWPSFAYIFPYKITIQSPPRTPPDGDTGDGSVFGPDGIEARIVDDVNGRIDGYADDIDGDGVFGPNAQDVLAIDAFFTSLGDD